MIIFIILVIILVAFLSMLEEYIGKRYKMGAYVCIGIMLILIASFRVVGNDNDSESYESYFLDYDNPWMVFSVEYSFRLFSRVINLFTDNVHVLFFVYALIGVVVKLMAIRQLSEFIFLSLFTYLCHFFILHDMTQIRASVAAAFFLLSIKPLCEGRKRTAFLIMCVSVFFHYSALVIMPLLFFSNKELGCKWRYVLAAVVPIGYLVYFMGIDLLTAIPLPYIGDKLEIYRELKEYGRFEEILVFKNPILLMKITVFYLLIIFYDIVYEYNKNLPLLLKIMGISLGCFFMFASLPVLSGRLYELFGVVDIILIPNVIYIFKPRYISKIFVFAIGLISFFMDVFVYELII